MPSQQKLGIILENKMSGVIKKYQQQKLICIFLNENQP